MGAKRRPARIVTGAGEDLTATLGGASDGARLFAAGTVLTLAWTPGDSIAGLVVDCARASAPSTTADWGVRLEAERVGAWQAAGHIHPRAGYDGLAAPLADGAPLRLTFVSDTYVREVAGYSLAGAGGEPTTVATVEPSATDREGGLEQLAAADSVAVELAAGQRVTLHFDGPAPVPGRQRTLFLDLVASFTPEGAEGFASGDLATEAGPASFALYRNQPNPFGGGTTIRFDAPRATHVRLEVFDAQGRRVRTLADRAFEPGTHAIAWDGTDAGGRRVGPGVYLYRVTAEGFRDQRRMVLLGR